LSLGRTAGRRRDAAEKYPAAASARKAALFALSSAPYPEKPHALTGWLRFFIASALCSPLTGWAAQEGIQANPKRWLLIFPAAVVVLVVVLIRITRKP